MVDFYNHVKHCTTHPKFLHSNSTSHRWVFGAIAELIDNAIDPDVSASQFCIDMKEFNGEPCLVFMDNGCGLVPEKLHKMLSFGHSKKQMTIGDRSIGKHGNGFKSGTMRLGKDVLVLTKCANSMTAGFLSQTFLADTGAEDILIPQVSWNLNGRRLSPLDLEIEESLRAICKYSIFPDEDSLLAQLEAIPVTGAILIISNLRRHEGVLELDFETDPHDIRITTEISSSYFQQLRPNQPNTTEVPMDYSLRAYVSILYKVPRMQIFIRDKKVKTKRIAGLLSQKETESYKPYGVAESISIELGFNTENKNLYGMMLYHRNRLIKAYMRVGIQLEENERGMGVIGLAEADFLQPTHNKQDFDDTTAYRRLLKKLSDVLSEYWWEKKERVYGPDLQLEPRSLRRGINVSTLEDVPDVIWVQCDNPTCLKWRILPSGTDLTVLPDIWYCEYHPDVKYRSHDEPEQDWDTSVQHEVIERRKERKREYDREKKEREAERKRQRLDAATKESQEALQKRRDALAKELQKQEAREEQAQQDQKRLEEEMKKFNEEYAAVEAKHDKMLKQQKELAKQLELAREELVHKAKEKQASISAQMVFNVEAQEGSLASMSIENGHAVEGEVEHALCNICDSVGGNSTVVKGLSDKQKTAGPSDVVSCSPARVSCSDSHPVHQVTLESNGILYGYQAYSTSHQDNLGNSHQAAGSLVPPLQKARDVQGTGLFSTVGCTNNLDGSSSEQQERPCKALHLSQPVGVGFKREPSQGLQLPSQKLETSRTISSGEIRPGRVPPIPPTSPGCSPSFSQIFTTASPQAANPDVWIASSCAPEMNQHLPEAPTTNLEQRSSMVVDPDLQDLITLAVPSNVSLDHQNGSLLMDPEGVDKHSEAHKSREKGNGEHATLGPGAPLSGLRLAPPPGCSAVSFASGIIAVHLPMDTMVSASNYRSEAELTLDKAVFSLQRHLRLALNTLVRLGGSVDSNLFELDALPGRDSEVVSICEKATTHVETRIKNYRQDVASLKAELAYLMADKMQQGQGQNFKIQHISRKLGIGAEVLKQG